MITKLLLLSTATASISFVITQSDLFEKFRAWVGTLWMDKTTLLYKLVTCGFCLGYWIALTLVLIYRFRVVRSFILIDIIVTALIVAFISAFEYFLMMIIWERAMEGE